MELTFYNDRLFKVFVEVNGVEYAIKPSDTIVVHCASGVPTVIKLSRKMKSFAVLNPFSWDSAFVIGFESFVSLILTSTYTLTFTGNDAQYFAIKDDAFNCDKYYQYERLILDDPAIKNNCTYEITRKKKIKKRVNLFNAYTIIALLALAFVGSAVIPEWENLKTGTMNLLDLDGNFLIGIVLFIWSLLGKARVLKRYKKAIDIKHIQACFNGNVEEYKEK